MKTFTLALSSFFLAAPTFAAALSADLILRHAVVVDGEHSTLIDNQAIAIRDGTIVDVGEDDGAAGKWHARTSIDATQRYVIPGLS